MIADYHNFNDVATAIMMTSDDYPFSGTKPFVRIASVSSALSPIRLLLFIYFLNQPRVAK